MLNWFKRDKKKQETEEELQQQEDFDVSEVDDSEPDVDIGDFDDFDDEDFIFEFDGDEDEPATDAVESPPTEEPFEVKVPEAVQRSVDFETPIEEVEAPVEFEAPAEVIDVPAEEPSESVEFEATPVEEVEEEVEPESVEPVQVEEPENKKKGFFAKLRDRLAGTRAVLNTRIDHLLLGVKEIDEDVIDELEEILVTSDLGINTTQELLKTISGQIARKELSSGDRVKETLRNEMSRILDLAPVEIDYSIKPYVLMVVGVNGVGKTTTIAKLASRFKNEGKNVMLVAGDTFRAAAVEQLSIWADRVGVEIVKQKTGADPSAVVFDALHAAKARGVDLVIVDTAGRLHTKVNLMEELKKIHRVADREHPGSPHQVLLVLDATTGQNAINQAKQFNEAVRVDQIAMTKLDGTAKGGVLVGICHELGIPIRYIGIGEGMDDLKDFNSEDFVNALFG